MVTQTTSVPKGSLVSASQQTAAIPASPQRGPTSTSPGRSAQSTSSVQNSSSYAGITFKIVSTTFRPMLASETSPTAGQAISEADAGSRSSHSGASISLGAVVGTILALVLLFSASIALLFGIFRQRRLERKGKAHDDHVDTLRSDRPADEEVQSSIPSGAHMLREVVSSTPTCHASRSARQIGQNLGVLSTDGCRLAPEGNCQPYIVWTSDSPDISNPPSAAEVCSRDPNVL